MLRRLRYRIASRFGRFAPRFNGALQLCERLGLCVAYGRATGQIGSDGNERLIVFAPEDLSWVTVT